MKSVVLAGGKGSRLYPVTRVTNKHLLQVFGCPTIYYPIQTVVEEVEGGMRTSRINYGRFRQSELISFEDPKEKQP